MSRLCLIGYGRLFLVGIPLYGYGYRYKKASGTERTPPGTGRTPSGTDRTSSGTERTSSGTERTPSGI